MLKITLLSCYTEQTFQDKVKCVQKVRCTERKQRKDPSISFQKTLHFFFCFSDSFLNVWKREGSGVRREMVQLHETFVGAIATVVVGQLLRRLFLKSNEQKKYIMLLSKILIYVTIPATLFRTMSNVRKMPWDGLYLLLCCLVYECTVAALGALIFHRVERKYRGVTVGSSVSFAIGMFFFGIMENLAGDRGVMYLAFFDVPNAFFVYVGQPLIFHYLSIPEDKKKKEDKVEAVDDTASSVLTAAVDDGAAVVELDAVDNGSAVLQSESPEDIEAAKEAPDHSAEDTTASTNTEGSISNSSQEGAAAAEEDEEEWSPKTFAKRLVGNMSLWGIIVGLILGLTGVRLPTIVTNFINIPANGNSCVSYLLIGLYLDINLGTLRKLWKYALCSLALRYGVGITVGVVLYFTLGTLFSPLARLIVLVGFCMPLPASVTALAAENGVDSSLPAFVTNLTFIVSFAVLWAMIGIAGVPVEADVLSSSSLSSSGSSFF